MARMMNPSGERFRGNLQKLSTSQTSIETLSKYAQFHGDDARAIADVWWEEFVRADSSRCLAFIYLLSDIAHAFKGRSNPFIPQFEPHLSPMVDHVIRLCESEAQSRVIRTLKVWQQRQIFDPALINKLISRFVDKPDPPNSTKISLIDAIKQHESEALEDVLIAARAAPYLANPSLQGADAIRAHESRLESRRVRIQQLIGLLSDRLKSEQSSLAACLSDLAVCRSKLEHCSDDSGPNKRTRLNPSSTV